jgi:hypothetical protein
MNNNEKLTLLKGTFAHEDASEILLNLYDSNIKYLKLKNYGSLVRFEKNDDKAKKTLEELQGSLEKLREIIEDAKQNNKSLIISSEIKISTSNN